MLNDIQKSILKTVSDMTGIPDGAVNIRLDGQKAFRQNSEHIQIVSKTDKDGIDIKIAPFTKSENVHIPVVLSKAGFHDMVYNDFFVGEASITAATATPSTTASTLSTSAKTRRCTILRSTTARAKAPASAF